MGKRRRLTGSRLLGEELRRRRGRRSLEEVARLSRTAPYADRVEPIAYSTLSMLERGVTMPSAQSLLTLSVLYHLSVQELVDLIALERYHARKPSGQDDAAKLERAVIDDLRSGRPAEAFAGALRCLELARESGGDEARMQETGARILAGLALWKLGWLSQAAGTFRDVVDDLDARADLRGWAYQNLVEVERGQGRLASARAYAREGLELAAGLGNARLSGTFHGSLANLERDFAERSESERPLRLAAALAHHLEAQRLADQAGDEFLWTNDRLNEGVTRVLSSEPAAARRCFEEGIARAASGTFARLQSFGLLELGKLELAEGRPERARSNLRLAETLADRAEARDLSFLCSFYLLKTGLALGEESRESWRRCRRLRSSQEGRLAELEELDDLEAAREFGT